MLPATLMAVTGMPSPSWSGYETGLVMKHFTGSLFRLRRVAAQSVEFMGQGKYHPWIAQDLLWHL